MGNFFVDDKIIMLIIDITRIKVAIDPNSGITLTPIIFTSLESSDNGTYIVEVPSIVERIDFGSFCPSTYTNMGNSITSGGIITINHSSSNSMSPTILKVRLFSSSLMIMLGSKSALRKYSMSKPIDYKAREAYTAPGRRSFRLTWKKEK